MRKSKSDALHDRISEKIAFEKRLDEADKEACGKCIHQPAQKGKWCRVYSEYQPYCKEFLAR